MKNLIAYEKFEKFIYKYEVYMNITQGEFYSENSDHKKISNSQFLLWLDINIK